MRTFKTFSTSMHINICYPFRIVVDICNKYGKFLQTYLYNSIENMCEDETLCCVYGDYLVDKYFLDNVRRVLYIKIIPFNSYLSEHEITYQVFSYYSYNHEDHHRDEVISKMMSGGFCFTTTPLANEVLKEMIHYNRKSLKIENTISNDPATIVFWNDGSKTVVKADDEDSFDLEKGILYAALKKHTNKKEYDNILRTIDSAKGKE